MAKLSSGSSSCRRDEPPLGLKGKLSGRLEPSNLSDGRWAIWNLELAGADSLRSQADFRRRNSTQAASANRAWRSIIGAGDNEGAVRPAEQLAAERR